MVKARRREDQDIQVLFARPAHAEEGSPATAGRFRFAIEGDTPEAEVLPGLRPAAQVVSCPEDTVLVLDLGADDALLMAGAMMRRIPRGSGGKDLLERAAAGAAAWRDERLRIWKRSQLPGKLIAFSEQLNEAETISAVCGALTEHALRMVEGYETRLLLREGGNALYREVSTCVGRKGALPVVVPAHPRFGRPGLLMAADVGADSLLAALAPLFTGTGVAMAAHVPVGEDAVLLLLERRDERIFSPDDWELLRTLADQANAALRRVRLLEDVRRLSLTDPLTGLANRRRMQVVLEHAWAAARRGEPLALVVIDLDHFKDINDEYGHLEGDQVLCAVADALKGEVRGADLAVRYGGDEFVVVLPRGTEAGGEALVERVRARLRGRVGFSYGVAAYRPGMESAEALIGAADARLYAAKHGGAAGTAPL